MKKELYNDGLFYSGYLWDCLKHVETKSDFFCKEFLSAKDRLYLFWDLHSSERVPFWEGRNIFPLESVLRFDFAEYAALKGKLPEDVYIFDDSFLWSIVFTHESDSKGRAFNYFVTPLSE